MNTQDVVSLQIDENLIKSLLEPKLEAALKLALTNNRFSSDAVLQKIISTALDQKVDSRGQPSTGYDTRTLLDWMVNDAIHKMVREQLTAMISEMAPLLRKEMELALKKRTKTVAASFVDSLLEMSKGSPYSSKIEVAFSVVPKKQD